MTFSLACSCSDVQYADIPDGTSDHGVPRFYRNALVALKRAVSTGWAPANVQFGLHFGDILDGYQAQHGKVSNRLLCKMAKGGQCLLP